MWSPLHTQLSHQYLDSHPMKKSPKYSWRSTPTQRLFTLIKEMEDSAFCTWGWNWRCTHIGHIILLRLKTAGIFRIWPNQLGLGRKINNCTVQPPQHFCKRLGKPRNPERNAGPKIGGEDSSRPLNSTPKTFRVYTVPLHTHTVETRHTTNLVHISCGWLWSQVCWKTASK